MASLKGVDALDIVLEELTEPRRLSTPITSAAPVTSSYLAGVQARCEFDVVISIYAEDQCGDTWVGKPCRKTIPNQSSTVHLFTQG